jgi:arabinose-5-phosphate isomerase
MNQNIQEIIEAESRAILNIASDNDYEGAIELIFRQVHTLHGKVVTSGLGKAGQVAQNLASTLCSTGTPAVFLHPSEAQHGELGILHHHDALILVSNSGKTRELLELVTLCEHLHGDNPVIVITGDPESPLAQVAEVILFTGAPEETCPLALTPTTSITTMVVISHILAISLIHKIGFTRQEFFKRHHGGYLGSLKDNE